MSSVFNNSSLNLSESISTSIQPHMASVVKNNSSDIRGQSRKADYEEVATTDSFKNKRLKPTETSIVTTTALNSLLLQPKHSFLHNQDQNQQTTKPETATVGIDSFEWLDLSLYDNIDDFPYFLQTDTSTTTARNILHQAKQLKDEKIDSRKIWSDAELEYLENLKSERNEGRDVKYTWNEIAKKMQEKFPNKGKTYTERSVDSAYFRYVKDSAKVEIGGYKLWSDAKIELLKTLISEKDEEEKAKYTLNKMAQEINRQFPKDKPCTRSSLHKYITRNNLNWQEQLGNTVTTKRYYRPWSVAELEYLKDLGSKTDKDGKTKYSWLQIAEKMHEEFPNNGKIYTERSVKDKYRSCCK